MTGLFCTGCGTRGKAECKCGVPYSFIPARDAAALAVEAHPDWSDVRLAEAVGCSDMTIARTRKAMAATSTNVDVGKRVGKDGKARGPRKAAVPEAVTVRPIRCEVSEKTETRPAPYEFNSDVDDPPPQRGKKNKRETPIGIAKADFDLKISGIKLNISEARKLITPHIDELSKAWVNGTVEEILEAIEGLKKLADLIRKNQPNVRGHLHVVGGSAEASS